MKKIIFMVLIFIFSTSYSQSRKDQIQTLNFKMDSLYNVITTNNIKYNQEINNLKKENLQLSNSIVSDRIAFEEKINIINDSLYLLNNINKNLNVKNSKQKELILLFDNALSIENREFDPYKDSKLFSDILFLNLLYHFDKIDGYFISTYYGVVLGNRLVNAQPTDAEKKIFEDELQKYMIYFLDNFNYDKNKKDEMIKDIADIKFDDIVKQLNDVRPAFEPDYYLINNNINWIFSKIKNREEKLIKLKTY